MENAESLIRKLFTDTFNCSIDNMQLLKASGSNRKYYRITYGNQTIIGAHNDDRKENEAFLGFTQHFLSKGFAVPEIYAEDLNNNVYLISDLGDTTLYDFLSQQRNGMLEFSSDLLHYYQQALNGLLEIQLSGGQGLNFDLCYPRSAFDEQSIQWDLNYFKYYFLKLAKIPFNEQLLENDFNIFYKPIPPTFYIVIFNLET